MKNVKLLINRNLVTYKNIKDFQKHNNLTSDEFDNILMCGLIQDVTPITTIEKSLLDFIKSYEFPELIKSLELSNPIEIAEDKSNYGLISELLKESSLIKINDTKNYYLIMGE